MSLLLGLLTGGSSIYIWIGAILALLFLVWKIIAAYNAPKVEKENTAQAKEQTERIEARQKGRNERAKLRNERRQGRRQNK